MIEDSDIQMVLFHLRDGQDVQLVVANYAEVNEAFGQLKEAVAELGPVKVLKPWMYHDFLIVYNHGLRQLQAVYFHLATQPPPKFYFEYDPTWHPRVVLSGNLYDGPSAGSETLARWEDLADVRESHDDEEEIDDG